MTFSELMHFFKTEDVTSDHTITKYTKLWNKTKQGTVEIFNKVEYPVGTFSEENSKKAIKWHYPGRNVEWLTTWHDSLKFYAFDVVNINYLQVKAIRLEGLQAKCDKYAKAMGDLSLDLVMINQVVIEHIDEMYKMYDKSISMALEAF